MTRYHFDPDGILRTPDGRVAGECYPMSEGTTPNSADAHRTAGQDRLFDHHPLDGDIGDQVTVEIGPPTRAEWNEEQRQHAIRMYPILGRFPCAMVYPGDVPTSDDD